MERALRLLLLLSTLQLRRVHVSNQKKSLLLPSHLHFGDADHSVRQPHIPSRFDDRVLGFVRGLVVSLLLA